MVTSGLLQLTDIGTIEDGIEPQVYRSFSLRRRRLEPAGTAFFELFEQQEYCSSQYCSKSRPMIGYVKEGTLYPVNSKSDDQIMTAIDINKKGNSRNVYKQPQKSKTRFSRKNVGSSNVVIESNQTEDSRTKSNTGSRAIANASRLKHLAEGDCLYRRLGLSLDASQEDIRQAYRHLAVLYHPDKLQLRLLSSGTHNAANESIECSSILGSSLPYSPSVSPAITSSDLQSAAFSSKGLIDTPSSNWCSAQNDHSRFLKIQEAYEILSDLDLRVQYDSALPFDETIPDVTEFYGSYKNITEYESRKREISQNYGKSHVPVNRYVSIVNKCRNEAKSRSDKLHDENDLESQLITEEQQELFFYVFTPVFQSNARWSAIKPVPQLGNMQTSLDDVKKFYDFWSDFRTIRVFTIHNEFDLESAESREERRWMMRENLKIQRKYGNAEAARIQKLVQNAHSLDPRLINNKIQLKIKERTKKQLSYSDLQKKNITIETEKLQNLELEEKEEVRQINDRNQYVKVNAKKWRQSLRFICNKFSYDYVNSEYIERMCSSYDAHTLRKLCYDICSKSKISLSNDISDGSTFNIGGNDESHNKKSHIYILQSINVTNEQRALVDKAIKKQIDTFLEVQREKTCQSAGNIVNNETQTIQQAHATWTLSELSLLARAIQKYPAGTLNRWANIAKILNCGKTVQQVIEKSKELSKKDTLASVSAEVNDKAYENYVQENQNIMKQADVAPDIRDIGESISDSHKINVNNSTWTVEQQTALEAALLKYPTCLGMQERWNKITDDVPGKTRKECIERFKQIRSAILAKKAVN